MKNAELTITKSAFQLKITQNHVRQKDIAALEQGDVAISLSFKDGLILFFLNVRHYEIVTPFTAQMIPSNERLRRSIQDSELLNLTLVLEDKSNQIYAVRVVTMDAEFSKCLIDVLTREAAQEWLGAAEYQTKLKKLLNQYPRIADLRAMTAIAHARAGV
jgi:hypothetical protein